MYLNSMFQFAVHFQYLSADVFSESHVAAECDKCNEVLSFNQLCLYTVKVQHLRVKFLVLAVVLMSSLVFLDVTSH